MRNKLLLLMLFTTLYAAQSQTSNCYCSKQHAIKLDSMKQIEKIKLVDTTIVVKTQVDSTALVDRYKHSLGIKPVGKVSNLYADMHMVHIAGESFNAPSIYVNKFGVSGTFNISGKVPVTIDLGVLVRHDQNGVFTYLPVFNSSLSNSANRNLNTQIDQNRLFNDKVNIDELNLFSQVEDFEAWSEKMNISKQLFQLDSLTAILRNDNYRLVRGGATGLDAATRDSLCTKASQLLLLKDQYDIRLSKYKGQLDSLADLKNKYNPNEVKKFTASYQDSLLAFGSGLGFLDKFNGLKFGNNTVGSTGSFISSTMPTAGLGLNYSIAKDFVFKAQAGLVKEFNEPNRGFNQLSNYWSYSHYFVVPKIEYQHEGGAYRLNASYSRPISTASNRLRSSVSNTSYEGSISQEFIKNKLQFKGIYAVSLSNQQASSDAPSAVDCHLAFQGKFAYARVGYKRVAPAFASILNPFVISNRENLELKLKLKLFQKRLGISFSTMPSKAVSRDMPVQYNSKQYSYDLLYADKKGNLLINANMVPVSYFVVSNGEMSVFENSFINMSLTANIPIIASYDFMTTLSYTNFVTATMLSDSSMFRFGDFVSIRNSAEISERVKLNTLCYKNVSHADSELIQNDSYAFIEVALTYEQFQLALGAEYIQRQNEQATTQIPGLSFKLSSVRKKKEVVQYGIDLKLRKSDSILDRSVQLFCSIPIISK
jgi:hypothetical protein